MSADANPLLARWSTPFEAPPFADIRTEHYHQAFEAALAENRTEIDTIAGNEAEPSFDNTLAALERSGLSLDQVASVFFNLAGSNTNDELQAIEREMAPILSRHHTAIYLNDALFRRVDAVFARRAELGLPPRVFPVFGMSIGFPDLAVSTGIKPRLPPVAVVHREQYSAAPQPAAISAYDSSMSAFQAEQRMGPPAGVS